MVKYTLILVFIILVKTGFSFQDSTVLCWYWSNNKDPEISQIQTRDSCLVFGKLGVSLSPKALREVSYDKKGFAWVVAAQDSLDWILVKKGKGILLWGIPPYDNSHDEFQDGIIRIVRNKKWGFANQNGKTILEPIFDGALPFVRGEGRVCSGCITKCVDEYCEYHKFDGGTWYSVSKKGIIKEIGK